MSIVFLMISWVAINSLIKIINYLVLLSAVRGDFMFGMSMPDLVMNIIIIVIALTFHELAHGLMALFCGDTTAKNDGRLTLNPIAHIDPIGFFMLLFARFGWAKPVRFNASNLRNPGLGRILIALAGPAANFLLAFVVIFLVKFDIIEMSQTGAGLFFQRFFIINIALAIFNLFPIPPLDGSHLVSSFLERVNPKWANLYFKYGAIALIGIIVYERISDNTILPIGAILRSVASWMLSL